MAEEKQLGEYFSECVPLFIALGDVTRLTIIQCLYEISRQKNRREIPGRNVKEITEQTNLSRPAVSHHLKILKEAGLIDVLQKGVCNFYYLNSNQAIEKLIGFGNELLKNSSK